MKLKDGRTVILMPWAAQTPAPWKQGYSRVFIPFTESELKSARHNGPRGHIQVVRNSKIVAESPPLKKGRKRRAVIAA